MLTDSHCHLFNEDYDNIKEVIDRAKENGVNRYIVSAYDLKSCEEAHYNCYKYDNYYYTLGIHPENSSENYNDFEHFFYYCLPNPRFLGIGEIGLDYSYEGYNKDEQINLFEKQLLLAEREYIPVVIHSRDATKDTVDILKKHHCKGVIHCFSGSLETAKEYLDMGYYIGVGGVSTFKNAKIKEVIKEIPLDKIILETDSPYLAPEPVRGTKNEPANIKHIAENLANLKGISFEEVSEITENNVNNLFFKRY